MSYLPADYETVADRLTRWWKQYPKGRIETTMVHYDSKTVVFRACGYSQDDYLVATGFAEEVLGSSPVNKTSFVENCETSAIGRMISNSPLGTNGPRPSQEEMRKVERRGEPISPQGNPMPETNQASPKQKAMLRALYRQKGHGSITDAVLDNMTKQEASRMIDELMGQEDKA
jgi:hypothetical protein